MCGELARKQRKALVLKEHPHCTGQDPTVGKELIGQSFLQAGLTVCETLLGSVSGQDASGPTF